MMWWWWWGARDVRALLRLCVVFVRSPKIDLLVHIFIFWRLASFIFITHRSLSSHTIEENKSTGGRHAGNDENWVYARAHTRRLYSDTSTPHLPFRGVCYNNSIPEILLEGCTLLPLSLTRPSWCEAQSVCRASTFLVRLSSHLVKDRN